MSESLPFMNSTGLVSRILNKIIEAQTPQKYSLDFQANKLGYGSGSAKPFIPLLKRIGMLSSDGSPTNLYKKFRNSTTRPAAMATAIRKGYAPLYAVSEYAHDLDAKKLKDVVIQVTGQERDSSTVIAIVGTFNALKSFANFDETNAELTSEGDNQDGARAGDKFKNSNPIPPMPLPSNVGTRGMNLAYTINLNLPETKDPEVFDAIFTSLKTKLLS